jgi:hypothetical protein
VDVTRRPADTTRSTFGLRIGTHEALLAVADADGSRLVGDGRGLPVRIGLSADGRRIGDAVDPNGESLVVSPREPFMADPQDGDRGEPFGPERRDDPDALPITDFLAAARERWLAALDDRDDAAPIVVSIPGAYDAEDERRFLVAVSAAGFDPVGGVREPLPTAYDAGYHRGEDGPYLALRVGPYWFDAAIVEPTESDRIRTLARSSRADAGTELFERTLARWLRENHPGAVPEADATVRASIRNAVERRTHADEESVPLFDGAVDLDDAILDRAWEGVAADLGETLRGLLDDAGVDPADIDDVGISGHGTAYPVVVRACEGSIGGTVRRSERDDPWDAPSARGAARIGSLVDDVTAVDGTLRRPLVVETLTPDGADYRRLPANPADEPSRIVVQTTEDDQTRGRFRVGAKHRSTGAVDPIAAFEVGGLPTAPAGDVRLELEFDPEDTTPSGCDCTASLRDGTNDADAALTVTRLSLSEMGSEAETAGPWFTPAGREVDDLDVPDRDRFEPAYRWDPDAAAYESLSPKRTIDRLVHIRNGLQRAANGGGISGSALSTRVNKLDVGLQRSGVEIIDPDPGEEIDDTAHRIEAMEPAPKPEGTIVEVREPGYRIDDSAESYARVVVSEGPPDDDGENVDGGEDAGDVDDIETAENEDDVEDESEDRDVDASAE